MENNIVEELSQVFKKLCDDYVGDYSIDFIQNSPVFYCKLMLWFIENPLVVTIDERNIGPNTVTEVRKDVIEWINRKYNEILKEIK